MCLRMLQNTLQIREEMAITLGKMSEHQDSNSKAK